MVLNALGCRTIIQITRRDGASNFGQTVAKRLFGLGGFKMDCPERLISQKGLTSDMASDWSRLYNLRNPQSSFNRALFVSDGVWCTDWDRYRVEAGQLGELVDDAYHAEFYLPGLRKGQVLGRDSNLLIECVGADGRGYDRLVAIDAREIKDSDGKDHSEYAGCIPLVDAE
jgi:hypothetical protein